MAQYNIYDHPQQSTKAIRQGFAWETFISPLYLGITRKRMKALLWIVAVLLAAFLAALYFNHSLGYRGLSVLGLMFTAYCGLNMYRWSEELLLQQGYQFTTTVKADSSVAALATARASRQ